MKHIKTYIESYFNFFFVRNIEFIKKYKTIKKNKFIPFTKFTFANFIICCIYLVLAPIYITYHFLFFFVRTCISSHIDRSKIKKIYINSMNRIYNYIEKDLIKKGDYILNFPYKCKLSGYVFINIFNLITLSDILHAYTNSLYSYIKLISNVGVNGALYSITSFKYFILYYALKSLPDNTEIVFSNQKDRWALLFSNFENLRKTLIQHGTTFSRGFPPVYLKDYVIYNPEDNLYYQNIPYRLNEINTLYAFSQLEAKYMMLSEHEKKCLQLKIIGYNMTCFNKFINNKSSVLIVGHYYQYCNEEKFLLNFFKNISIHVFLKTHPQVGKKPYRSLMKKYNFDLIEGKCFPKVDFLISYNSTLAYEYEAIRVPVIYYDEIRLADNELDAKSLKNKINSILTKKPGNNLD